MNDIEKICKEVQCPQFIVWSFGYGDCISCKLQGESYDIESVADNCPYKDKFSNVTNIKRMNKLEYIPGDLVYIHGSLRIISNCDGYYTTYYDENESLQEVNVNVIEGIPLTPEILEKNGWKRDGKWYCLSTKRAYLYTIQDTGQPDEFLICAGGGKFNLTSVSFVHQLQHFLFGLNLNSDLEV